MQALDGRRGDDARRIVGQRRARTGVVGDGLAVDAPGAGHLPRHVDSAGARVGHDRGAVERIHRQLLALEQVAAARAAEPVLADDAGVDDVVADLDLLDHRHQVGGVVAARMEVVVLGAGRRVVRRAGAVPGEHDAAARSGLDHRQDAGLGERRRCSRDAAGSRSGCCWS